MACFCYRSVFPLAVLDFFGVKNMPGQMHTFDAYPLRAQGLLNSPESSML